jgi:hypothetical protein
MCAELDALTIPICAVRRLPDGRWQIIGRDWDRSMIHSVTVFDDPDYRPPKHLELLAA